MSNPRRKIIYDSTLTNAMGVDANGAASSTILDSSGDPFFTAANPGYFATEDLDIRALDSATDSVTVVATDLDVRDLSSVTDSITVVATDLDVRDLSSASDSVTVVATDLDIRDLTSASDSVAVTTVKPDGTNTMPSLDAAARRGYVQLTDGTNEPDIEQAADDSSDMEDKYGIVTNAVLNGRISNTAIRPLRIDSSTHSIQTIDYSHHEVHSGDHYFVVGYVDLAINHVLQFTWQMPDTTKWIHWIWKIKTESETLWQVYEGATITNPLANAITPLNSNRNSGNSSGTTMRYEDHADVADANTDVTPTTLIKSGISGAGKDSGEAGRESELILDQNGLYVLRATATAAGYINFDMEWYEHTDKN